MANRFVLRVYGICINDLNQVLVTSERWNNVPMLKFPGGGMEWGEGAQETLKREFLEELGVEIKVLEHFYTTDFFQQSAFSPQDQIISLYYLIEFLNNPSNSFTLWDNHFPENETILFHWINPENFTTDGPFTFPIDRIVGMKLKSFLKAE